MPGSRGIELPSKGREASYFALIEQIQTDLARCAAARGEPLDAIDTWGIQVLAAVASFRRRPKTRLTEEAFLDFARQWSDFGSRIYQDDSVWVPDQLVLDRCLQSTEQLTNEELLVLLGRSLDFGRTLRWEVIDERVTKDRDLIAAKSQGVFYTPSFVADYVTQRCLGGLGSARTPPSVGDPAVGGGILLLAAARQMLRRWSAKKVLESLYGVDTDPVAVEVASFVLALACNAWSEGEPPPTLGSHIVNGDSFAGPVRDEARGIDGAIGWAESFPKIFDRPNPGFDCVVINPPWGRYKVDSDWLIAKQMRLDPKSLRDLKNAGRMRSADLRSSGLYELSMTGVLDKSRIGLERAIQITRNGGRLGAIVPSTITADSQSFEIRRHLLYDWALTEITEFPETARLFYDVSQSVSVLVAVKGESTTAISVRAGVRSEDRLTEDFTGEWSRDIIERISPKLAIPVRAAGAQDILERMYRFPRLGDSNDVVNARGEIDVSAFRDLITTNNSMTPLVRGDHIDRFINNGPSQKKSFIQTRRLLKRLEGKRKLTHFHEERVVGRQCSYLYKQHRLTFALVPPEHAVANSCNYLVTPSDELRLFLLGLLNSTLMNWRFKLMNSNNHVANSEIDDLPLPLRAGRKSEALVSEIAVLADRLSVSFDAATARRLDRLVFSLFNLSMEQRRRVLADEENSLR